MYTCSNTASTVTDTTDPILSPYNVFYLKQCNTGVQLVWIQKAAFAQSSTSSFTVYLKPRLLFLFLDFFFLSVVLNNRKEKKINLPFQLHLSPYTIMCMALCVKVGVCSPQAGQCNVIVSSHYWEQNTSTLLSTVLFGPIT